MESLRNIAVLKEHWTSECENAFLAFKNVLTQQVCVHFPDYAHEFILAVDASQYGLGLVLYQIINGEKKFILFASKSLNKSQRNYSATKRELLAIIFALQRCRSYLYGFKFQLHTDHKALTYLFTQKHVNYMMQTWMDVLLDFSFSIVHCPGVLNVLPDVLSRCYPTAVNVPCLANLIDSQERVVSIVRNLNDFVDERLNKKVPPVEERPTILQDAHSQGHFGVEYMFTHIWNLGIYWTTLRQECTQLVGECVECLKFNVGKFGYHPARSLSADAPFDACAIDTAGPYQTTPRGYNYFLLFVCLCTRYVVLIPLKTLAAEETAWELWKLFCMFPVPKSLISDNGTQFVNKVIKALYGLMGVSQSLIAAYNPAANGVAERLIGVSKSVLSKVCGGNIINFDRYLPAVQMHLNTKVSLLTKTSPLTYVFARPQNAFADYSLVENRLMTEPELVERNKLVQNVIFPTLAESAAERQQQQRVNLDARRNVVEEIPVGSKVMIKDVTRSTKHDPYWIGPFVVLKRTKANTYSLLTPDGCLFGRNVPVNQLKVITMADLVDVSTIEPNHEVERILDHRGNEDDRQYLVKWRGHVERTWEPSSNLTGTADNAIRSYWSSRANSGEEKGRGLEVLSNFDGVIRLGRK